MRVITCRNVHEALPLGLDLLAAEGYDRASRNGPVRIAPWPVATVYERPCERVIFWPERDANPFLHLYEALWMLRGRRDVAPLARYASRMREFSDDGETLHGAYGHRWLYYFGIDQLAAAVRRLRANKDDRRVVLGMWDAREDLDRWVRDMSGEPPYPPAREGRDVPCNLTATLQVSREAKLDLVVFCRSNDVVWGAYGANAVHFSVMQEYVARQLGVEVGTYTQVSVNYHAYEATAGDHRAYHKPAGGLYTLPCGQRNPYNYGWPRPQDILETPIPGEQELIDALLLAADAGTFVDQRLPFSVRALSTTLYAHALYRFFPADTSEDRFRIPYEMLLAAQRELGRYDWLVAAEEWLRRRWDRWVERGGASDAN